MRGSVLGDLQCVWLGPEPGPHASLGPPVVGDTGLALPETTPVPPPLATAPQQTYFQQEEEGGCVKVIKSRGFFF